ncbi:hypothetical protein, partial [Alistipes shahii]|uniref:hypothetical protein n=1 Tax=Alistipes shahii TaxID=328814 RepID=UPI00307BD856
MKKLFVICSWALLLGGCKSESGASDPDGDKPVPPPSAELLQKIEDLNAGLVSLKVGSINSIFYFLHKAAEP